MVANVKLFALTTPLLRLVVIVSHQKGRKFLCIIGESITYHGKIFKLWKVCFKVVDNLAGNVVAICIAAQRLHGQGLPHTLYVFYLVLLIILCQVYM